MCSYISAGALLDWRPPPPHRSPLGVPSPGVFGRRCALGGTQEEKKIDSRRIERSAGRSPSPSPLASKFKKMDVSCSVTPPTGWLSCLRLVGTRRGTLSLSLAVVAKEHSSIHRQKNIRLHSPRRRRRSSSWECKERGAFCLMCPIFASATRRRGMGRMGGGPMSRHRFPVSVARSSHWCGASRGTSLDGCWFGQPTEREENEEERESHSSLLLP